MSKISIWYFFFIHDVLKCLKIAMKNCHKSIQNKVDIALYRASRIPELPGPLSGPGPRPQFRVYASAPEASILGGGGGGAAPNENIGGQTYRFAPSPQ